MKPSMRDLYWVIVFAVFLLIVVLTFWLGGKGNDIVSYIGFASALISIVLAMVAIFYAFIQNVSSQQNIGEMKSLVSEASRIITEKAESMENVFRAQQGAVTLSSPPSDKPKHAGVPVLFSLLQTSNLTRLFAYFLFKSHMVGTPLSIEQFVRIAKPLVKMGEAELSSYTYGTLHGLSCCLAEYLRIEHQTEVQLKELPGEFKVNVLATVEWMKEKDQSIRSAIGHIDALPASCSE